MKEIKISVLITAYNLEKYISGAIDSVLMQKGDFSLEILVGDDGSKDGTTRIIKDYMNKYPNIISLYEMPRDEGINYNRVERSSANRLNLLKNATGDYVCFLDGDDFYIDDHKFDKQIRILEEDKSLSMCTHNVVLYYGEDSPVNKPIEGQTLSRAKKNHRWSFNDYWSLEFIQSNAMLYRNYYEHGNEKCNESLKKILDENEALRNDFDDNNITLSFFRYGDMYYMSDVCGAYRQSASSSWNGIDELKKHCSNMIGYSIEEMLLNKTCMKASYSRHYVNFKYIKNHVEALEKDNCQPFYDTASNHGIETALRIYNTKPSNLSELNRLVKLGKVANNRARIKRIIKKALRIY